jgi:hypothetical protein
LSSGSSTLWTPSPSRRLFSARSRLNKKVRCQLCRCNCKRCIRNLNRGHTLASRIIGTLGKRWDLWWITICRESNLS